MQPEVLPCPAPALPAARRPRAWLPLLLVALILLAYTAFYAVSIKRHKALPYWDQTHYIGKTHDLAEKLRALPSWTAALHPDTYLDVPPRQRPPLLMILPAALLGPSAGPHKIAISFLIIRMAALAAAVWILARVLGDLRWAPLALLTTLGGGYFLNIEPHLFLMDHAIASFALLLFAAAVWDIKSHSLASAGCVLLASLAVVLVKPIGFALVAVVVAVLAFERLVHEAIVFRREPHQRKRQILHALLCALPYLLLAMSLLYLRDSSYGQEVRQQYALGMKGYWSFAMSPQLALRLFTGILPPWLLVGAIAAFLAHRERKIHLPLLVLALPLASAWTVINFRTYTIDERSYWVIMPILCTVAAVIICRSDRLRRAATVLGAGVFGLSLLIAAGGVGRMEKSPLPALVFGLPAEYEQTAPEVGLKPIARWLSDHFLRGPSPAPAYLPIYTTFNTNYAEPAALRLAARYENANRWSPIVFGQPTFGSEGFSLDTFTTFEWFLSKNGATEERLIGDAWVKLRADDALLTDPQSPLHACFEPRQTFPVTQWFPLYVRKSTGRTNGAVDTATLWQRKRLPTIAELRDAARWIEPRFRDTPGHAEVVRLVARYEELAVRGHMLETLAPAALDAKLADADPAFRDLDFGGLLTLRGIVHRRDKSARTLELFWEAKADQPLDRLRFAHMMAADGAMTGQLDAPQDATPGAAVKAGTLWRDVIDWSDARFDRAATCAIGLVRGQQTPLRITPDAHTDWDGHRLLIPLKR